MIVELERPLPSATSTQPFFESGSVRFNYIELMIKYRIWFQYTKHVYNYMDTTINFESIQPHLVCYLGDVQCWHLAEDKSHHQKGLDGNVLEGIHGIKQRWLLRNRYKIHMYVIVMQKPCCKEKYPCGYFPLHCKWNMWRRHSWSPASCIAQNIGHCISCTQLRTW